MAQCAVEFSDLGIRTIFLNRHNWVAEYRTYISCILHPMENTVSIYLDEKFPTNKLRQFGDVAIYTIGPNAV